MLPKHLGNYEVIEQIGAGGMGEVYRARDTRLARDVALKLLPEAFAADAERLARFDREARLLASLNHPGIGAIYGFEQHDKYRFLVLELVPGEDLAVRIGRGALSVEEALPIARDIAEALEFAHEQGVVHRDLKPANVKITPEGRVKVLDFGLAKAFEGDDGRDPRLSQSPTALVSSPTIAGVILGTAAYMSPEQARGKFVDKRSDVFSFGCVLYELLTGRLAFAGETVSDTLASVLKTQPDFNLLPPETPRAIRDLLKRCLEKDVKLRLRDIGEARIAIDHARHAPEEDVAAPAAAAPAARGRRDLGWIALALAVGVGAYMASRATLPRPAEQPVRKFEIALMDSLVLGKENEGSLALSPDGRRLAYVHKNKLWLRNWDETEAREVPGSEGADIPFWSPDGTNIAFLADKRFWRNKLDGGNSTAICTTTETLVGGRGAVWTEDDRIVYSGGTAHGLFEVSALGGDPVVFRSPAVDSLQDYHEPSALPGGGFVFVAHDDTGPNTLSVLVDGKTKHLLRTNGRLWSPVYSTSGHILYRRQSNSPGVWAVQYSLATHEVTGEPFLVVPNATVPSVSSNGMLVCRRSEDSGLVQMEWVRHDGTHESNVGPSSTAIGHPAVSPDGKRVAVAHSENDNFDVRVFDVERETFTRLTSGEDAETSPVWAPDGRSLYYVDVSAATIYRIDADGTGQPVKITHGLNVDVAPDGKSLAVQRSTTSGSNDQDLFVVDLSDSLRERVLVSGPARQVLPVISPRGNYVAYTSDESGRTEIYVTHYPDGTGKWQVSVAGGAVPRWGRDGRHLYFVSGADLMEVTVTDTPALTLGRPSRLFVMGPIRFLAGQQARYGVADDGRFLMTRALPVAGARRFTTFHVVESWYSEFKDSAKK